MKNILCLFLVLCVQSCSGLFYYPTQVLYSDPAQQGIDFENIFFQAKDGTRLHAWYFPPTEGSGPRELIVFFHGNAQNITSHYLNLEWVREHGHGLLIFDYRGYGLSEGAPNQQGLFKDGVAAIELAEKLKVQREHTGLIAYGQSLGGIVLTRVLEEFDPALFELVVLDSTFLSYQAISRRKLRDSFVFSPLLLFVPLLISDEYAPRRFTEMWTSPVLVVHGLRDTIVEPEFGREIYERLSTEQKWFWEVKAGAHIDVYFVEDRRYRKKLIELIEGI